MLSGCSGCLHARARIGGGQTTIESDRSSCKPWPTQIGHREGRRDHQRTVNIGSSPAGQEQGCPSDVFRVSNPHKGHGRNHIGKVVLEAPRGHWMTKMSAKRIARDRCVPYSPRTFAQEWTWKTNEFSHERGRKRRGRIKTLTTRDGVASDALPSEPTAHSAREVVETGLAGAVGVSFVVRDHDPFNRTNLAMVNEHNQWPREHGEDPPTLMIRAGSR
jgi:hypothetical protein